MRSLAGQTDCNSSIEVIKKEIDVLRNVSHENIVTIGHVFHDEKGHLVYIFLKRVKGGDLFDFILEHNGLKEHEAKFIFYQILLAGK